MTWVVPAIQITQGVAIIGLVVAVVVLWGRHSALKTLVDNRRKQVDTLLAEHEEFRTFLSGRAHKDIHEAQMNYFHGPKDGSTTPNG